jgi:hypothetical protein
MGTRVRSGFGSVGFSLRISSSLMGMARRGIAG